nr:uncharacterized protein LOC117996466 [Maniola hyperantus]
MRLTSSELEYDTGPTRFQRFKMKCKGLRCSDLKSTKFLMSTTTTMFTLTGLLLLILGIVILENYNEYDLFLGPGFFVLPRFVIATAVFILFTAVLGFYGAISQKYKIVVAYVALLVTILICELTITILAFQMKGNASMNIYSQMRRHHNSVDGSSLLAWDNLQREVIIIAVVSWIAHRLKSKKNSPQHELIIRDALKIEAPNPVVNGKYCIDFLDRQTDNRALVTS